MLQVIIDVAFKVVLLYLSPVIFIISALAVADKIVDLVKQPFDRVRRRRY